MQASRSTHINRGESNENERSPWGLNQGTAKLAVMPRLSNRTLVHCSGELGVYGYTQDVDRLAAITVKPRVQDTFLRRV